MDRHTPVVGRGVAAFFKAVAVGTAVASAVPLLLTIPLAFMMSGGLLQRLLAAFSPILISAPIVLFSCAFLGLPSAWILRKAGRESADLYMVLGGVFGALVPVVPILFAEKGRAPLWLGIIGAFSGALAARTWWRARLREIALERNALRDCA